MDARHQPLIDPASGDVREQLDRLASWVADRLDHGDDEVAWTITVAVEALVGRAASADDPRPPKPVIGRRFAAAHRRLLSDGIRPPRARRAAAA